MAAKEAGVSRGFLDGGDGAEHAEGGTGVLCEGRGGGLEEDLYAVEWSY